MLILTGTCRKLDKLHIQCTNKSWKPVCQLSFPNDFQSQGLNHGPDIGGFDEWFQSWDRTNDDDVHRLCEISWNASRALLPNPLKVTGGVPHGYGILIDGKFYRVDLTEVNCD